MLAAILGGAAGPWVAGVLYDATRRYSAAFWIAAACSILSMLDLACSPTASPTSSTTAGR